MAGSGPLLVFNFGQMCCRKQIFTGGIADQFARKSQDHIGQFGGFGSGAWPALPAARLRQDLGNDRAHIGARVAAALAHLEQPRSRTARPDQPKNDGPQRTDGGAKGGGQAVAKFVFERLVFEF